MSRRIDRLFCVVSLFLSIAQAPVLTAAAPMLTVGEPHSPLSAPSSPITADQSIRDETDPNSQLYLPQHDNEATHDHSEEQVVDDDIAGMWIGTSTPHFPRRESQVLLSRADKVLAAALVSKTLDDSWHRAMHPAEPLSPTSQATSQSATPTPDVKAVAAPVTITGTKTAEEEKEDLQDPFRFVTPSSLPSGISPALSSLPHSYDSHLAEAMLFEHPAVNKKMAEEDVVPATTATIAHSLTDSEQQQQYDQLLKEMTSTLSPVQFSLTSFASPGRYNMWRHPRATEIALEELISPTTATMTPAPFAVSAYSPPLEDEQEGQSETAEAQQQDERAKEEEDRRQLALQNDNLSFLRDRRGRSESRDSSAYSLASSVTLGRTPRDHSASSMTSYESSIRTPYMMPDDKASQMMAATFKAAAAGHDDVVDVVDSDVETKSPPSSFVQQQQKEKEEKEEEEEVAQLLTGESSLTSSLLHATRPQSPLRPFHDDVESSNTQEQQQPSQQQQQQQRRISFDDRDTTMHYEPHVPIVASRLGSPRREMKRNARSLHAFRTPIRAILTPSIRTTSSSSTTSSVSASPPSSDVPPATEAAVTKEQQSKSMEAFLREITPRSASIPIPGAQRFLLGGASLRKKQKQKLRTTTMINGGGEEEEGSLDLIQQLSILSRRDGLRTSGEASLQQKLAIELAQAAAAEAARAKAKAKAKGKATKRLMPSHIEDVAAEEEEAAAAVAEALPTDTARLERAVAEEEDDKSLRGGKARAALMQASQAAAALKRQKLASNVEIATLDVSPQQPSTPVVTFRPVATAYKMERTKRTLPKRRSREQLSEPGFGGVDPRMKKLQPPPAKRQTLSKTSSTAAEELMQTLDNMFAPVHQPDVAETWAETMTLPHASSSSSHFTGARRNSLSRKRSMYNEMGWTTSARKMHYGPGQEPPAPVLPRASSPVQGFAPFAVPVRSRDQVRSYYKMLLGKA